MSTMHANGPEEVPARFEALGALAGLRRDAVHAQLQEALRVVVHVARRGSERRVDRVGVVVRDAVTPGLVRVVTAATSTEGGLVPGPGLDRLVRIAPAAAECCRRVPG